MSATLTAPNRGKIAVMPAINEAAEREFRRRAEVFMVKNFPGNHVGGFVVLFETVAQAWIPNLIHVAGWKPGSVAVPDTGIHTNRPLYVAAVCESNGPVWRELKVLAGRGGAS